MLINDHDPKPLYYQFEAKHRNQFSWATSKKVRKCGASGLGVAQAERATLRLVGSATPRAQVAKVSARSVIKLASVPFLPASIVSLPGAAPLVFRQFVGQFLYSELFLAAEIAKPFLGRVPVQ